MGRRTLNYNVMEAAIERLMGAYADGDRVVSTFSAGKDSGVVVELHIETARRVGALPIDVVMRDEEIMLPGTFEYAERMAAREEVNFHWFYACQPIVNIFNRKTPFWWVFDPQLSPDDWVRKPPPFAQRIHDNNIEALCGAARFPPKPGKRTIVLMGLRAAESLHRNQGIHTSGGWVTRNPTRFGHYYGKPIYDWVDGDVWRAIHESGWDYNSAYDALNRLGLPRNRLRIAPPTMQEVGIPILQAAFRAWPMWAEAVSTRLAGVRLGAHYGISAVRPLRRHGETWEACFDRACIREAPDWIARRAEKVRQYILNLHEKHATSAFPEQVKCFGCPPGTKSWRTMTLTMYNGDAFCSKQHILSQVQPEFFREGAGTWGQGAPAW